MRMTAAVYRGSFFREDVVPVRADHFLPGSTFRPETECRLLYDRDGFHLRFDVKDFYIRCTAAHYQDRVCQDSCVEFFIRPPYGEGYLNFEFSGNTCMLASHVLDPERTPGGGLKKSIPLPAEADQTVIRRSSLPARTDPEITGEIRWFLEAFIPFDLFRNTHGLRKAPEPGEIWRGNFYKCGDKLSHPHWACWSPVPVVNFHLPGSFGEIEFGK